MLPWSFPGLSFQTVLLENDFKAIFPELFLTLATVFLILYGVIYRFKKTNLRSNFNKVLQSINLALCAPSEAAGAVALQLDGHRQLVAGRRGAVQARVPHQHRVVLLLRLQGMRA